MSWKKRMVFWLVGILMLKIPLFKPTWGRRGVFNAPHTVNQPKDPQKGLQTPPNLLFFSYFYMTSLKPKKNKIFGFSQQSLVFRRGWCWITPHHLTYIFNPVPNRVNLSLNGPFYFYYFLKKVFSPKKVPKRKQSWPTPQYQNKNTIFNGRYAVLDILC